MVRLTPERAAALHGLLPAETLSYLSAVGLPAQLKVGGMRMVFTVALDPIQSGELFQVADVHPGWKSRRIGGLERATGHFYIHDPEENRRWLVNHSISMFIQCWEASERIWQAESENRVDAAARGEILEQRIKAIDPEILADPEGGWSVMVEELKAGVI